MRFLLLTPGTGHFYCGSCLRDNALGSALTRLGHEVEVVPLYLPLVLEEGGESARVQMGGINMYLQQKSRLAHRLPRWLADLLDSPGLLRWASRRGNLTEARDLGAMTLSMLQGERGRQAAEVAKLTAWVTAKAERPDVIAISNAMLCGVVRPLKQAIGRPVVASLQGEAPFLDALPAPFAAQAWQELRERAADVDVFVPVSHSYGALMRERLGLDTERVRVVHNGIDERDWQGEPEPIAARRPRTIGYLARMCRDKGLHTLVEAFVRLKASGRCDDVRLRVAGARLAEDTALVAELQRQLRAAGCGDDVDWLPNVDRAGKLAFLRTLSVLSVPATYGESFGLYLLEAMASGVPVVQPRHGAFPEILEATGGGVLCAADDPAALADALEEVLFDEERAQALADRGRKAVLADFTAEGMARGFVDACRMTVRN